MKRPDDPLFSKFENIVKMTEEIPLTQVAKTLKVDVQNLFDKLIFWINFIDFKIRGGVLVVNEMNNYISALDEQFDEWMEMEETKEGKIEKLPIEPKLREPPKKKKEFPEKLPKIHYSMQDKIQILNKMKEIGRNVEVLYEIIQPVPINYGKLPDPVIRQNAFKTLVAGIISVQSKDEISFRILNKLWEKFNTPEAFMNTNIDEIIEIIRPCGLYTQKADNLKTTAAIIHNRYLDKVPSTFKELKALPGVGDSIANYVSAICFGIPSISVNSHVQKIANRMGIVSTKTAKQTEKALKEEFPKELWSEVNRIFMGFGKMICGSRTPECHRCPFSKECPKIGVKK